MTLSWGNHSATNTDVRPWRLDVNKLDEQQDLAMTPLRYPTVSRARFMSSWIMLPVSTRKMYNMVAACYVFFRTLKKCKSLSRPWRLKDEKCISLNQSFSQTSKMQRWHRSNFLINTTTLGKPIFSDFKFGYLISRLEAPTITSLVYSSNVLNVEGKLSIVRVL